MPRNDNNKCPAKGYYHLGGNAGGVVTVSNKTLYFVDAITCRIYYFWMECTKSWDAARSKWLTSWKAVSGTRSKLVYVIRRVEISYFSSSDVRHAGQAHPYVYFGLVYSAITTTQQRLGYSTLPLTNHIHNGGVTANHICERTYQPQRWG